MATAKFTNELYHCFENEFCVISLFLDPSKDFDSLNHNILLERLENLGIRGLPIKLFEGYLSNRK